MIEVLSGSLFFLYFFFIFFAYGPLSRRVTSAGKLLCFCVN